MSTNGKRVWTETEKKWMEMLEGDDIYEILPLSEFYDTLPDPEAYDANERLFGRPEFMTGSL